MNAPFAVPSSGLLKRYEAREALGYLPRGWIDGLTLSNDTTDATNDIGIAAGCARSTVNIVDGTPSTLTRDQIDLDLPIAIIKQLDVAFAPENYNPRGYSGGDRSGGRSSSVISNTTWHAILAGGMGLQPDVLLHDAATQSSILAEMQKIGGYTAYRRIGSVMRETAAIAGFIQQGDYFQRTVVATVSTANPGATAVTRAIAVPVGINVEAQIYFGVVNSAAAVISYAVLTDLAVTDQTPAAGYSQITPSQSASGASSSNFTEVWVRTNTSAQVRSRLSASDASVTLHITPRGWTDQRGKNA